MLIFDVSDRATPDRILAGDPYSPGGVVSDRRIRPWIVPLGSLLLTTGRIDDTVIQDVQVTSTREDGKDVTAPAATILRFGDGEITE